MKKTSKFLLITGIGSVVAGATVIALNYSKKKANKIAADVNDITIDEQISEIEAVSETASYPYLAEADMMYLNDISEIEFNKMEELDNENERAIQHKIEFETIKDLDVFKTIVINEGFVVTVGEDDKELLVLNISLLNSDLILSKVFYLANLAKEHGGNYKKWIIK